MNRLRNLDFRHAVMPFVLAALALRALIPAGFMPGSGDSFAFTAELCSPEVFGNSAAVMERFELPGDSHAQPHCDFCAAPPLAAPPTIDAARVPPASTSCASLSFVGQVSTHAPDRAPSARAPPA